VSKTTNNTNNKTQISSKITQWLKDEEYSFAPYDNPYTDFCLQIKDPDNEVIYVGMRKDRKDSVIVYTRSDLSKLDKEAFSSLPTDMKQNFIFALHSILLSLNLHYDIKPSTEQMEYLEITKDIFFDGLTKDKFFDTIDRVSSSMRLAHMAYFKYLPRPKGSNSSLRCLFL
jgi:hypothetical protein